MFGKLGLTTCRTGHFSRELLRFGRVWGVLERAKTGIYGANARVLVQEGLSPQATNELCVLLVEQWLHKEGED
jgi:hypothetical protein